MARFIRNRTKLKGKAPGSYIFLGEQKMEEPRVRIIRYSEDKYEDYVVKTAGELPMQDEDSVSWINIDGMHDTNLLKEIGMRYSIPNLLMEDILNTDHRPGVYYVVTRAIQFLALTNASIQGVASSLRRSCG